jgi:3-oxosteroid 1-dehydrogenase
MWDEQFDVLVVGSGAGALTAACRAHDLGCKVLILEKTERYGGTSASSGGGLWIPNNHLMKEAGIEDNEEDALSYIKAMTGPDVAEDVVDAFVHEGPKMLRYLVENTRAAFEPMIHYADYYQSVEGSRTGGRSIDPLPYHAKELGESFHSMGLPHIQTRVMGMMGYTNQEGAILLSKAPGWWKVVLKLAIEYFADIPARLKGKRSRRLVMGNALIGRLRHSLNERGVEVRLSSPVVELVREGGRVTGAVIEQGGVRRRIAATKGVIVGAGGFEHSDTMRKQYLPGPTHSQWSAAHTGNTGDLIRAGIEVGAATHLMDEAWWGPTIRLEQEDRARMLFTERSMPGCILVNAKGQRFVNESVAYTTAVQAMYEGSNLPCFAIFDSRYRREYPFGPLLPAGMGMDFMQPRSIRRELLSSATSLTELASKLGIDSVGLKSTVSRFNGFANTGVDEDFHRGEDSYDKLYGDVRLGPNICLAELSEAPFYGIEVFPGDIGTKGGLLTNASAQVLDAQHDPIPGLYAIGNSSASAMGRYYPGAGATLGPAMTFGYVAAEHLAAS